MSSGGWKFTLTVRWPLMRTELRRADGLAQFGQFADRLHAGARA